MSFNNSLQQRNVAVDCLLVIFRMFDGSLNSELDFTSIFDIQIVFAQHNIQTLPYAMTRCKLWIYYVWLFKVRLCQPPTCQDPIRTNQCSTTESFFVAVENRNLPWPLKNWEEFAWNVHLFYTHFLTWAFLAVFPPMIFKAKSLFLFRIDGNPHCRFCGFVMSALSLFFLFEFEP